MEWLSGALKQNEMEGYNLISNSNMLPQVA